MGEDQALVVLDQEEVARVLRKYDFTAMPVVDDAERLLGLITIDDVMDVVEEEQDEDVQRLAAVEPIEEQATHLFGEVARDGEVLAVGVGFGAVARGDNEWNAVGEGTNIQELCMLHTDPGCPVTIGKDCTIGHKAIIHGCTIGDESLIGMGATVLNRAVIGKNCLVGAGALVTEGKVFEDGTLIVGAPAKVVRKLTDDEIQRLRNSAHRYAENARRFAAGLEAL